MFKHKMKTIFNLLTISDQVDPEKLNWDKGFWDTESSGEEDAYNFANVGWDQISDELEKNNDL